MSTLRLLNYAFHKNLLDSDNYLFFKRLLIENDLQQFYANASRRCLLLPSKIQSEIIHKFEHCNSSIRQKFFTNIQDSVNVLNQSIIASDNSIVTQPDTSKFDEILKLIV